MLAAAMGSLSATATVSTTGVLGFLTEDTIAQSGQSEDQIKANTLRQMSMPITLDVEDQPLEDIMNFIRDFTDVELEPVFADSITALGMERDTPISLRVTNVPAISVLERVLKKAERIESIGDEYTWQLSDIGSIECGPKSILNENQRIELYDISDLIMVVPDFDNPPQFNIQQNTGGGGGGGGTSSPFGGGGGNDIDIESSAERAQKIIDLIEASVEPDQWANAGGDGASLTIYGNSLVITAPDYIHRQIVGYSFWPAHLHTIKARGNKRSIQIKPDPSMSTVP